ncbi:AMP-binding protein [Streptomyces sp. NPDC088560]|uniref:AMP-binding protein n=1 Tax=Streptomyces sp. NPDC088560 TaxID=3365868 RepID=UPI00380BA12B
MSADAMFRAELIRPVHELLAGHAARQPDRIAFKDARRSLTWAELDRRTARVAGHLVGLGLTRGASAAIYLPNRVEAVESRLAVARASAVGVPLDPHRTDAELGHLLDDCAARLVITGAAQLPQVRRVLAQRPGTVVVLVGDTTELDAVLVGRDAADESLPRYETLAATWSLRDPPRDDLGLDEPAWLLYTTGTTGKPKGVVSTQRAALWATASCNAPLLGLSGRDRVLVPMPLFHTLAHNICVLGVLAVGAGAYITDEPAADEVLRTAREENSTFLVGSPALYQHMVERTRTGGSAPPGLRVCMVAGSPCPPSLHEAFRSRFGVALLDSYGSSETCGAITTNLPHGPYVPGSCGRALPGVTLRLTDPRSGAEAGAGEEGEVWVSSPALMLGYHGRPEATEAVLCDGWYRTGDLARQDANGYLTVTGRLKEVIVRGGENVHPAEVESVLLQVPGVGDAAVGAKPHPTLGEVPVAYLVPGPDGLDVEAVLATCRDELPPPKRPEEVHAIDEVPRDPAGKIARQRLSGLTGRLLWRRSPGPSGRARYGSAADLGLADAEHPLLAAVIERPDTDEVTFTGRLVSGADGLVLSRSADGRTVVPGVVLLDLALHAAGHLGCGRLREFDAVRPLVLPAAGGVQVQVTVGGSDTLGVRAVTVYTRRDSGASGRPWVRQAYGTAAAAGAPPRWQPEVWPPAGAWWVPVDEVFGGHGAFGATGPGGAPAALHGVWRRDDELFVEVRVPEGTPEQGSRFGVHPALLEAVARAELWAGLGGAWDPAGSAADRLGAPDLWRGVTLHAARASVLRARLTAAADGTLGVTAVDAAGAPVLTVDSVRFGALFPAVLQTASATP